jgi:hypothetical protein
MSKRGKKPPVILKFYCFNPRIIPEGITPKLSFVKKD